MLESLYFDEERKKKAGRQNYRANLRLTAIIRFSNEIFDYLTSIVSTKTKLYSI